MVLVVPLLLLVEWLVPFARTGKISVATGNSLSTTVKPEMFKESKSFPGRKNTVSKKKQKMSLRFWLSSPNMTMTMTSTTTTTATNNKLTKVTVVTTKN